MQEATGVRTGRGLHRLRRRAAGRAPALRDRRRLRPRHRAAAAPAGPLRRASAASPPAPGTPPPDWVRAGAAGAARRRWRPRDRRAHAVERGVVDLVEAVLLQGREGERFAAVVVDDGLVQLREPAVRAKLAAGTPEPGSEVTVRLDRADPATRTVAFSVAGPA